MGLGRAHYPLPLIGASFAAAGGAGMVVATLAGAPATAVLASAALAFAGFLVVELSRRQYR